MPLRIRHLPLGFLLLAGAPIVSLQNVGCYPAAGEGVDPPAFSFYFPVGLAVSKGGNVLYAVNSDFDLQWNGGTLQAYDLNAIRRDVLRTIANPNDPNVPRVTKPPPGAVSACPGRDGQTALGQTCAPPVQ